jgi:SAM-dependent methyltransferase
MSLTLRVIGPDAADERREFALGRFDVFNVGNLVLGRAVYRPGWRWSQHVGAAHGAAWCEIEHVGFVLAGRAAVHMKDGAETELTAGSWFTVPAGHDSWVLGGDDYVSLHILGADAYAAPPLPEGTDLEAAPVIPATVEASVRGDLVSTSYDAVAASYSASFCDELPGKPLDRALLSCLAEQTGSGVPVADLGCGPGHVAAWLTDLGVDAIGIDRSREMIGVGRARYPQVEFREGDLLKLPAADGEFAGAVAFYSIIHLDPGEVRQAFREVQRVLRAGGLFLVSFHVGTEIRHLDQWFGQPVNLDFRFLEPQVIARALEDAGFAVEMSLERASYPGEVETRRAYLLARSQV